jgi:alanine transaminase
VNPPVEGDPSYPQWLEERTHVLTTLKQRAKLVADTFNSLEGFTCNEVAGAMYAFPKIDIPEKAIKKAESLGQQADFFYAMRLLETTGICIVPGSGFGQKPGTYHFRTTILPQPELLKVMLDKLKNFQLDFMKEYA